MTLLKEKTSLLPAPYEERLVAVNSNDDDILILNKKQLHSYGYMHRSSHVFIETFGGGFILQKKAKGTENADKWSSSVSGHVRYKETYRDAAIRETMEELGIKIIEEDLEEIAKIQPCKETGNEFVTLYSYLLAESETVDPNMDEIDSMIICPLKEIVEDIALNRDKYSPAFILLLNTYLSLEGWIYDTANLKQKRIEKVQSKEEQR